LPKPRQLAARQAAAERFPGRRVLPYVAAQLVGALVGSNMVKLVATQGSTLGATLGPTARAGLLGWSCSSPSG